MNRASPKYLWLLRKDDCVSFIPRDDISGEIRNDCRRNLIKWLIHSTTAVRHLLAYRCAQAVSIVAWRHSQRPASVFNFGLSGAPIFDSTRPVSTRVGLTNAFLTKPIKSRCREVLWMNYAGGADFLRQFVESIEIIIRSMVVKYFMFHSEFIFKGFSRKFILFCEFTNVCYYYIIFN